MEFVHILNLIIDKYFNKHEVCNTYENYLGTLSLNINEQIYK